LSKLQEFNNINRELSKALQEIDFISRGGLGPVYTKSLDHLPSETEAKQMHREIRKAISEKLKLGSRLNYLLGDHSKRVGYSLSFTFKPPPDEETYLKTFFVDDDGDNATNT
jgi:hypothetical protein